MNRTQLLERLFSEVDELRRMQTVYQRPPLMHQARNLREAEQKVDGLLAQLRDADGGTGPAPQIPPTTPAL